jgi:bifunctional non-homologous end joining protein LigD
MRRDIEDILIKHKEIWMEPKYDGIRLIVRNAVMLRKKKTEALSRDGKKIESVSFLINEFDRIFAERKIALDGELMAKDFQTLMTQVHRKNDLNLTMPRQYMVFDILSIDGNDITYLPYLERRKLLEEIFSNISSDIIKLVKSKSTNDADVAIDLYEKSVEAGYEGLIVKINSKYTRDRSAWWKMKPIKTADLVIDSLQSASSGRHAGKINCFGVKDKSGTVYVKVGSGITDEDVKKINSVADLSTWLGRIVEIKFNSITKQNEQGKRSLRHPVFLGFRFDKNEPEAL